MLFTDYRIALSNLVIVFLIISVCLLFLNLDDISFNSLRSSVNEDNRNSINTNERRRLTQDGFLPAKDRYFEFNGKKVHNVTSRELPKLFQVNCNCI